MSDEYVSPLGLDVKALEYSFSLLTPPGEKLVCRFYEDLFDRYPEVAHLFSDTAPAQQKTRLLIALNLVIENVNNPDAEQSGQIRPGHRH